MEPDDKPLLETSEVRKYGKTEEGVSEEKVFDAEKSTTKKTESRKKKMMNALVLLTPSFISSLAILVMFVIAEKVPCFVDDFAAAITTAFYTILCLVSIFICVTANKAKKQFNDITVLILLLGATRIASRVMSMIPCVYPSMSRDFSVINQILGLIAFDMSFAIVWLYTKKWIELGCGEDMNNIVKVDGPCNSTINVSPLIMSLVLVISSVVPGVFLLPQTTGVATTSLWIPIIAVAVLELMLIKAIIYAITNKVATSEWRQRHVRELSSLVLLALHLSVIVRLILNAADLALHTQAQSLTDTSDSAKMLPEIISLLIFAAFMLNNHNESLTPEKVTEKFLYFIQIIIPVFIAAFVFNIQPDISLEKTPISLNVARVTAYNGVFFTVLILLLIDVTILQIVYRYINLGLLSRSHSSVKFHKMAAFNMIFNFTLHIIGHVVTAVLYPGLRSSKGAGAKVYTFNWPINTGIIMVIFAILSSLSGTNVIPFKFHLSFAAPFFFVYFVHGVKEILGPALGDRIVLCATVILLFVRFIYFGIYSPPIKCRTYQAASKILDGKYLKLVLKPVNDKILKWGPGVYIDLSYSALSRFHAHKFSVAKLTDNAITVIMEEEKSWTKYVHNNYDNTDNYFLLYGPFEGPASTFISKVNQNLMKEATFMLYGRGTGVSPVWSILDYYSTNFPSESKYVCEMYVVWTIKSPEFGKFIEEQFLGYVRKFPMKLHFIYSYVGGSKDKNCETDSATVNFVDYKTLNENVLALKKKNVILYYCGKKEDLPNSDMFEYTFAETD